MRRLIATADDFGFSDAANAGVLRAHREGILRFASLMTLRPAAKAAAEIAKGNPRLGVGLHLELCADEPEKAGLRYFFSPKARAGLDGEIRAQIEALLALGVAPTHVDGHINIHAHPVIFPALCRLAREYKIPRVRLPNGELGPILGYPGTERVLEPLVLSTVFGTMKLAIEGAAAGLELPRTYGLLRSGLMSEDYVSYLIRNLPEGDTEIYFHPSADPNTAATRLPHPGHRSISELETLISPKVRAAVEESGVVLLDRLTATA